MEDWGSLKRVLVFIEFEFEISNVFIDFVSCSKFFKAFQVDVEEIRWKGDGFSSEVWEDAKSCDWSMQHRAVEFTKYIGTSVVSFDDDERAEISSSHLSVE